MAQVIDKDHQSQPHIFRPVAFNFQDIQENADAYLQKVRAEAARIAEETKNEIARLRNEVTTELTTRRKELEAAKKEQTLLDEELKQEKIRLQELRKEMETAQYQESFENGKKDGYEAGFPEGYQMGEQKALKDYDEKVKQQSHEIMAAKLETLMPALKEIVEGLRNSEAMFLAHWEQRTIQVATAIAQQAISRELPNMIDVPMKLLKEALELAVGSTRLKIRMHPQDVEALQPEIERLVNEITPAATAEIVSDIRISPGGCFLETTQGTIDQRVESRLSRIQEELFQ